MIFFVNGNACLHVIWGWFFVVSVQVAALKLSFREVLAPNKRGWQRQNGAAKPF